MLKIYHNPRCRKSREGLHYLQSKGVEIQVIEYLKNPLTKEDFKMILMKLNKKPGEIVRKQEDYYKKELKNKDFTDEEWLQILVENPKLMQRPIIVGKYKAVLAQPPELIDELL